MVCFFEFCQNISFLFCVSGQMLLKVDLQVPPMDQLDLPGNVVSVFAEKSFSLSFAGENSHLILQRLSLTFVKWILRFFEFLFNHL